MNSAEDLIYAHGMVFTYPTPAERDEAIALLCQHLGVEIIRTNATKHGITGLMLRPVEQTS